MDWHLKMPHHELLCSLHVLGEYFSEFAKHNSFLIVFVCLGDPRLGSMQHHLFTRYASGRAIVSLTSVFIFFSFSLLARQ